MVNFFETREPEEWKAEEDYLISRLHEKYKDYIKELGEKYGYDFVETVLRVFVRLNGRCPFCAQKFISLINYVEHLIGELEARGYDVKWFVSTYSGYEKTIEGDEEFEAVVYGFFEKKLKPYGLEEEVDGMTIKAIISYWAPEYYDTPPILWWIRIRLRKDIPMDLIIDFFKELTEELKRRKLIAKDIVDWIDFVFDYVSEFECNEIIEFTIDRIGGLLPHNEEELKEDYEVKFECLKKYLPSYEELKKRYIKCE